MMECSMTTPVLVVVDPFSSGNQIAIAAKKRGYDVICVCTYSKVPSFYDATFIRVGFLHHHTFTDADSEYDFQTLISRLKAHRVIAVITGCETGVAATDKIAAALGLDGNSPATSAVRRNKYLMHNALQEQGLRSIDQLLTTSLDALLDWAAKHRFEVVLKPVDSAGTNGVHVCHTPQDIADAFHAILSMDNIFELPVTQVLAQEFIGGIEYVVDSVSRHGEHAVTNICRYYKQEINGSMLYRGVDFISPDDPDYQELTRYCLQALDALGIVQGAAHSEIKIDERGPVLIESGARLQGSNIPDFVAQFADFSQLDLLLDAYLDANAFTAKATRGNRYHKSAKIFGFVNYQQGVIDSVNKALLSDLSSYYSAVLRYDSGDSIVPTTSLMDCPGWVLLLHKDEAVVDEDIATLLDIESENKIFRLSQGVEHSVL